MTKLKEYKMFIDGSWVESESKKTFETLNPENNEPWATIPEIQESPEECQQHPFSHSGKVRPLPSRRRCQPIRGQY